MSVPWEQRSFSESKSPYGQLVTLVVKDEAGRRLTRTMRKTDNLQVPVEFDMKDGDVVRVVKPHTLVTPVLKERYEESRSFACTVRRTDQLKGLMSFYLRTALKAGAVFELDGRRLVGDETPADLQLEDGAIIHVSPA
uniref:Rad60/SUMO-like domain-containing protein n=1 Tax=Aegilops tauschii TaxID=37682 RepID=M8AQS8_AEGTA